MIDLHIWWDPECWSTNFALSQKKPFWDKNLYSNVYHLGLEYVQQVPLTTVQDDYYNSVKVLYNQ